MMFKKSVLFSLLFIILLSVSGLAAGDLVIDLQLFKPTATNKISVEVYATPTADTAIGSTKIQLDSSPAAVFTNAVKNGELFDPELRFYSRNGLVIKEIKPNYMEDDKESRNYGAIMIW